MFAEALLYGAEILWSTHAHHAHIDNHHVLIFSAGVRERPLERKRVSGVVHGYHDATGRIAADSRLNRVLVLQLEEILHLVCSQGMFAQVSALGDRKDNEEGRSKDNAAHRGYDLVNRLTMAVEDSTRKTESSPMGISKLPMRMLGGTFQPRSPWYFQRRTSMARLLKVNDQMTPKA